MCSGSNYPLHILTGKFMSVIEEQERAIAASLQKPIINRFCIGVAPSIIQIVFFETVDIPYARAALCMSTETAQIFYQTLGEILADTNSAERKH